MTRLTKLRKLELIDCTYSAASLGALSCLAPTLTSLQVAECAWSPSVSSLTNLRQLWLTSVRCTAASAAGQLDAALLRLQRLTVLVLVHSGGSALPPGATGLPLRRLAFLPYHSGTGALPALPEGCYLQTCSHLLLRIATLASSPGVLEKMPRLNKLCLASLPDYSSSSPYDWDDLWTKKSRVGSLTQVSFELSSSVALQTVPLRFVDDLMRLRTARPDLKVFRYGSAEHANSTFMYFF